MTDYYCDLSADTFADRTGLDNSANVLTGPAGLQAAIRGTGSATALTAGDTLYMIGSGDLSRLMLLDCDGTDVTGWDLNDQVADDVTGGYWQGRIVETNVGGFLGADDMLLIWLDSGYSAIDVLVGDGINNATKSVDAGLAAESAPGIVLDGNSGSSGSMIRFVGVNDSWTEDGTRATLDADDQADCCMTNTETRYYLALANLVLAGSAGNGFDVAAFYRYSTHTNCIFEGAADDGIGGSSSPTYCGFDFCVFRENGSYGADAISCNFFGCTFYDNDIGLYGLAACSADECVFFENATGGCYLLTGSSASHCVMDANGYGVRVHTPGVSIYASRITNNTTGVYGSAPGRDLYCFYSGNTANFENDIHDADVRGESTRVTTGEIGYIDGDNVDLTLRNYGLTNDAAARRMEALL